MDGLNKVERIAVIGIGTTQDMKKEGMAANLTYQIPLRLKKKIDHFTEVSIDAFMIMLNTIEPKLNGQELEKASLSIGNMYGGWEFALPFMKKLYGGNEMDFCVLSPYIATAWFPTAAQGEISILNRIMGSSKTFSAGDLSSAYAVVHGIRQLRDNVLDIAFTGGCESIPHELAEILSLDKEFGASGTFIALEKESKAKEEERKIYGYIQEYSFGKNCEETIRKVMGTDDTNFAETIIVANTSEEELLEIRQVVSLQQEPLIIDVGKKLGTLFGEQVVLQILLGILMLHEKKYDEILIHAKDATGIYFSLLLKK